MRSLIGAAGAGDHCAPASPFRPPRPRPMSFRRAKCGLTRPAPHFTARHRAFALEVL